MFKDLRKNYKELFVDRTMMGPSPKLHPVLAKNMGDSELGLVGGGGGLYRKSPAPTLSV